MEDLKNQQQVPENLPLFESLKEEIEVVLENQREKNDEIARMINVSFDPENKTQSKGNVSTKPDMSPGNDHHATLTQNSETVQSQRNNHKEKEPTTSEDKNKKTHLF